MFYLSSIPVMLLFMIFGIFTFRHSFKIKRAKDQETLEFINGSTFYNELVLATLQPCLSCVVCSGHSSTRRRPHPRKGSTCATSFQAPSSSGSARAGSSNAAPTTIVVKGTQRKNERAWQNKPTSSCVIAMRQVFPTQWTSTARSST